MDIMESGCRMQEESVISRWGHVLGLPWQSACSLPNVRLLRHGPGGRDTWRQRRFQLLSCKTSQAGSAQSDSSGPVDGRDLRFCLLWSETHLWLVWADPGLPQDQFVKQ